MKRTLVIALVAGVLVLVLTTFLAPSIVTWRYSPPSSEGRSAAMTCVNDMRFAMDMMIRVQLVGLTVGLFLGGVVAIATRKKADVTATPPPDKPAAA